MHQLFILLMRLKNTRWFLFVFLFIQICFGINPSLAEAQKKKVLILYSTGGHATAAKSIEEMLNQQPDKFEVIRKDFAEALSGVSQWFYFSGYDYISQRANWINKLSTHIRWWQAEKYPLFASQRINYFFNQPKTVRAYIEEVRPDVIITTHFSLADTLAGLREQGYFKNIPIAWTHLDMVDNTFFRQIGDQLDMSFLPTEEMANSWSEVISKKKVLATGIPIMPSLLTRQKTYTVPPEIRKDIPTVFLIGGSMGALSYEDIIKEISNEFLKISSDPVQIIAVCGRNEKKLSQLKLWSNKTNFPKNIILHTRGFISSAELGALQSTSDIIISKPGGLTTFELLTSGKPVILAEGIGTQEQYNAKYVSQEGAALYFPKVKNIGSAVAAILLKNNELRQSLIENQQRLTKNFQLSRIVDWSEHATVTQAERPEKPLLSRIREQLMQTQSIMCSALFI